MKYGPPPRPAPRPISPSSKRVASSAHRYLLLPASSTTVAAYQTSILTATVTDGNAKPVMGEAVTFTIPMNESDACFINAASACVASVTVYTDVSGHAMALYHGRGLFAVFHCA